MKPYPRFEKSPTESEQTIHSKDDKYPNFPKYCGRVSGIAGAGLGYVGARGFSAVGSQWFTANGYKASKSAGIAGALVGFTCFYAAGFFAGKVAKVAHIPQAVEKGIDLIKKL